MSISPVTQQAINIYEKTEQTRLDIATAVLSKQLKVEKQQGQAVIKLIEQAASTAASGIDVKA